MKTDTESLKQIDDSNVKENNESTMSTTMNTTMSERRKSKFCELIKPNKRKKFNFTL